MSRSTTFLSYRPGSTSLHRAPAGVKLLTLFACASATFAPIPHILPVLSVIAILGVALSGAGSAAVRQIAGFALFYGVFISFFRIAGKPLTIPVLSVELTASLIYLWQLTIVLCLGTAFYASTGATEITATLATLQKKIRWPAAFPDIAFLFSLTLGFIPRVFSQWNALNDAWRARGGSGKGLRAAYRRMTTLVPLLIISLLYKAEQTDRAIKNRS